MLKKCGGGWVVGVPLADVAVETAGVDLVEGYLEEGLEDDGVVLVLLLRLLRLSKFCAARRTSYDFDRVDNLLRCAGWEVVLGSVP